ncbi:hypothetical protein [Puerhibacterium puerhi]|uniref:hypothetical protein n=1 Tax=Puerhibacterium puerhi TaxID=2692623 RepID=UPI00135752B4|nr:hypothetical protein [Puerhibacterium puerhi]
MTSLGTRGGRSDPSLRHGGRHGGRHGVRSGDPRDARRGARPRAAARARLAAALTAGLVLAATAACAGGAPPSGTASDAGSGAAPSAGGASPTSSGPAAAAPTGGAATSPGASPASPPASAAAGCPATGGGTPHGAGTHEVADVDGDGRADTAWLTGGADRAVGITTASGATFSAPVESASPVAASAVVATVSTDDGGVPIVLVDVGREVLLYSAAGCALTPTQAATADGPTGEPYTFDKGFTGYGTGVGCSTVAGRLRLAGLDAASDDGETFTVTRTFVELGDAGAVARNGETRTVARGAAADDPVVATAQETTCGDLVAGRDGPTEPQG